MSFIVSRSIFMRNGFKDRENISEYSLAVYINIVITKDQNPANLKKKKKDQRNKKCCLFVSRSFIYNDLFKNGENISEIHIHVHTFLFIYTEEEHTANLVKNEHESVQLRHLDLPISSREKVQRDLVRDPSWRIRAFQYGIAR